MKGFYGKLVRLLLATAFLLLVAWASLKMMTGDWDPERLLREGQKIAQGIGKHFDRLDRAVLRPARKFLEPKLEGLVQWAENLIDPR